MQETLKQTYRQLTPEERKIIEEYRRKEKERELEEEKQAEERGTYAYVITHIKEIREADDKRRAEEDLDSGTFYSEDGEYLVLRIWGENYIFDIEDENFINDIWNNGTLTPNKDLYLCVKKDGGIIEIHREMKIKEVEELAKKLNCKERDIHVHHISGEKSKYGKFENMRDNLVVLYKDDHAKRHGYGTWRAYQIARAKYKRLMV